MAHTFLAQVCGKANAKYTARIVMMNICALLMQKLKTNVPGDGNVHNSKNTEEKCVLTLVTN